MIKKKTPEQRKRELKRNIQKIIVILVITLILMKISKKFFFIALFTVFAYIGKEIRGRSGLKMIVLDPLLFCAILVAKFFGIKDVIIFVAINTLIIDFLTFIGSPGTFLNFFLFWISPVVAVVLFGNYSMLFYGTFAGILYAVLYFIFRTSFFLPGNPLADDPFQVISKSITSVIFTFLYITFFGPLFSLLMT